MIWFDKSFVLKTFYSTLDKESRI